ncbi:hypothetical protein Tco_0071041 [Tanacetum coccineum]
MTAPSEIPKPLYDLIQNAARARKSLKLNSNNRFAKRKLEHYEPRIPRLATFYRCFHELPSNWKYDPETSFMAHVPKPPTPPPKPKPKPKTKKKKIKITWSSFNYHGRYPLNKDEQKVWNEFTVNDKTKANSCVRHPIQNLVTVEDDMVVDLLGKFAVDTFNKSCQMYVNRDEDNKVSGAEFMECKFYKLTKEYIFYMTIEAIEQGIPGVYTTKVECKTKDGARTLLNFELTDRKPKWNRPWVKPHLESEVEYETVEDGSSDPQDFYKLTGMVHRETEGGGFNYHNPPFSAHIIIYNSSKDKNAKAFEPNVIDAPTILVPTEENLGDPIDIRVNIIYPEPVVAIAFPAAAVVTTLASHGEAILVIHEHLQGVSIEEEMSLLRFRMGMAEAEIASLRGKIKTIEAIETVTRS